MATPRARPPSGTQTGQAVPAHVAVAFQRIQDAADLGARPLPWRVGTTPWGVLVSEVMSQQTQAERVADRWRAFMQRFPSPAHLADADAGEVIAMWVGLGYNRRALNLHRAARVMADQHRNRVPDTREGLLALPGVGPYTADAVLAFAFDQPVLPVDTNIARVMARVGGQVLSARSARRWADGLATSSGGSRPAAALMDFGATTCTSRRPDCEGCVVLDLCAHGGDGEDPAARGAHRPRPQGTFEGSLRQARGRIIHALRSGPLTAAGASEVAGKLAPQALAGLEAEGMIEQRANTFALPGMSGQAQDPDQREEHR